MTVDNAAANAAGEAVRVSHPDDDELIAAKAAAEAAERTEAQPAEAGESADDQAQAGDAGSGQNPEPAAGQTEPSRGQGREPMIPKSRFDEAVAKAATRSAAEAAYWKGQADALAKFGGGRSGSDEPRLTPEQVAEKIEADLIAKADDFDQGKISLAEFKRAELAANRQLAELRQAPRADDDAAGRQDMRLQELTDQLPERFPVLARLNGGHIDQLSPLAEAELRFEGVPIDGSPRSTFLLRERIAHLAQTKFGGGVPQNKPAGQPDPNRGARDKIALAGRMAPDLTAIAQSKREGDPMSDEKFAGMDADEWAALPDSVRKQRLMRA